MRSIRVWTALGCCFFATAGIVQAQQRKAGLWDLTTVTTFQQSPVPAGSPGSPPPSGDKHKTQICLTQRMIDKYGAILPMNNQDCHLTAIVRKAHSMSAGLVCAGKLNGTGTVESAFTPETAKGKVHFAGSISEGSKVVPLEWTSESASVFKSPDCGSVKPPTMPDDK